MLYTRYGSLLLVWFASLSLLVAFIVAMAVQFIGVRSPAGNCR